MNEGQGTPTVAPQPAPVPVEDPARPQAPAEAMPASVAVETPELPPMPGDYLAFAGACDPEARERTRMTVAAVGDVLLHRELQRQAHEGKLRHRVLWAGVADLLAAADVTYANLEGPAAKGIDKDGNEVEDPGPTYDGVVYTGYPRFNYHPSVAEDLVADGVDVVSLANNHALDRGPLGVDRTIDAIDKAGLRHTGTVQRGEKGSTFWTTTERGGMRLAWLACTHSTNRKPDPHGQVLRCQDTETIEATIKDLAGREDLDGVVVTPHWGKQYEHSPSPLQRKWAHEWLDAGATLVIGNHPHVVQPLEKYTTVDGRETLVAYSLGNFVSHQQKLPRRSTALLYVGLEKRDDGVAVYGARYVPLRVREKRKGAKRWYYVEATDRVEDALEARALVSALLGPSNAANPDNPVKMAPHCDPQWRPAPPPKPDPEPELLDPATEGGVGSSP